MRSFAAILSVVSGVHADAAGGGWNYFGQHVDSDAGLTAAANEAEINKKWALHSQGDPSHGVSSPAPHAAFGAYVCDGYYQSPLNLPKKAIQTKHKGNRWVAEDVQPAQQVYTIFQSADMNLQRMYTNDTVTGDPVYQDKVSIPAASQYLNNVTLPSGSVYNALQFHWHYSSEHEVDGRRYPGELHIVHQRVVDPGTAASSNDKGFLVLGFFLEAAETSDAGGTESGRLFENGIFAEENHGGTQVRYVGEATTMYNLKNIFASQLQGNYLRYQGGLTTPPCSEAVEWFVFETSFKIKNLRAPTSGTNGGHACVDCAWKVVYNKGTTGTKYGKRSNRPTVAVHGRNVQRNRLNDAARVNPDGGATVLPMFNYKQPSVMWATSNCAGSLCTNQCQRSTSEGAAARQSPINFIGSSAYRGSMPVNSNWLKANTVGYVDQNTASASRWQLKNTGHGFNVIPSFKASGIPGTLPPSYFVKMINRAGTDTYYYKLHQFHIHFPSEHTVDGRQYDGEMHMVHVYDDASHDAIKAKIAGETAAKTSAGYSASGAAADDDHDDDDDHRVLHDKETGEKTVILDGKAMGATPRKLSSVAGELDALVLGFFLEVETNSGTGYDPSDVNSILRQFGFDDDKGLPPAKNEAWPVDVDTKKLMATLWGTDHEKVSMDHEPGDGSTPGNRWDARAQLDYFKYFGGLTTPGCNEGVQFHIFTKPLKIHRREATLFKQHYAANNRPTQPIGDRVILFNDMANPNLATLTMTSVNPYAFKEAHDERRRLTSAASPVVTGNLVAVFSVLVSLVAIFKMM